MRKDVMARVMWIPHVMTDGERDDSCENENQVNTYGKGLEFAHDSREGRGEDAVAEDAGEEDGVDNAIAWSPVSVSGDHDASFVC